MLTSTDVHLLVGLLTLITNPDGVDVELGDEVFDDCAEKLRDVDVTVKFPRDNAIPAEFHGIEVKKHTRALDVTHVEQICQKLGDMGALTRRALVSASGFSDPARLKASRHGLELFQLRDWQATEQPFGIQLHQGTFVYSEVGWEEPYSVKLQFPDAAPADITVDLSSTVRDSASESSLLTIGQIITGCANQVLSNFNASGVTQERSEWQGTVEFQQPFCIDTSNGERGVSAINVSGTVVCRTYRLSPELKILSKDEPNEPVGGCAVCELPNGDLLGLLVSRDRGLLMKVLPQSERAKMDILHERFERMGEDGTLQEGSQL